MSGIGTVNGDLFDDVDARLRDHAYDYTVLAGTQGQHNHRKKDRLFELVERQRLPVVLFAEGGGGRPGDTDAPTWRGSTCLAFHLFGRLCGLVPLVGVASGRCFAGNAALLGCCDVIIATEDANIGMGGPAMIEGGGLGVFAPRRSVPSPAGRQRCGRRRGGRRGRGRGGGAALPGVLPGPAVQWEVPISEAAPCRPREPPAGLRRPHA